MGVLKHSSRVFLIFSFIFASFAVHLEARGSWEQLATGYHKVDGYVGSSEEQDKLIKDIAAGDKEAVNLDLKQYCSSGFTERVEKCKSAVHYAAKECGLASNQKITEINALVAGLGYTAGTMFQQKESIQKLCEKTEKVTAVVGATLAAFQATCWGLQKMCDSSCEGLADEVDKQCHFDWLSGTGGLAEPDFNKAVGGFKGSLSSIDEKVCKNTGQIVRQLGVSALTMVGSAVAFKTCKSNLDTIEALANSNSNNVCSAGGSCSQAVNCSSPQFAGTPQCICQSNPRDPICANLSIAGGPMMGGSGSNVNAAALLANMNAKNIKNANGLGGGLGAGADSASALSAALAGKSNQSGVAATGQGSGSGALGGGSGKGSGATGSGAYGSNANPASQASASTNNGGSGSAAGGLPGGSYNANGEQNNYGKNNGEKSATNPAVDLRAFLPKGGYDPGRNVASVVGPDGITGPNTNIWEKISTRYQAVRPSMNP